MWLVLRDTQYLLDGQKKLEVSRSASLQDEISPDMYDRNILLS